jgi:hypothetical protein
MKALYVIGGVILVGAAAYGIYKAVHGKKDSVEIQDVAFKQGVDEPALQEVAVADVIQTKENVSTSVNQRHSEAAQSIAESFQTIFDESDSGKIETEHSEMLDKIDADLDDLLK